MVDIQEMSTYIGSQSERNSPLFFSRIPNTDVGYIPIYLYIHLPTLRPVSHALAIQSINQSKRKRKKKIRIRINETQNPFISQEEHIQFLKDAYTLEHQPPPILTVPNPAPFISLLRERFLDTDYLFTQVKRGICTLGARTRRVA